MNKRFGSLLAAVVTLAFSFPGIILAGKADGAGVDRRSGHTHAAWFLGNPELTVCYDGDLGLDQATVEATIGKAFETWNTYLTDKKIYTDARTKAEGFGLGFNIDSKKIHSKCDGKENIKIYLGTTSDEVEAAKKLYENPLALNHRIKKADGSTERGIIWLGLTPSTPEVTKFRMLGLLLHELGHVLGCDHVKGTIMDESIDSLFTFLKEDGAQWEKRRLSRIDGWKELFVCHDCTNQYKGRLSYDEKSETEESKETFLRFMGRPDDGQITAVFTTGEKFELTISDKSGSKTIPMTLESNDDEYVQGPTVFRAYRDLNQEQTLKLSRQTGGMVASGISMTSNFKLFSGSIKDANGTEILVQVVRNPEFGGMLRINYYVGTKRKVLFWVDFDPR